MPIPNLRYEIVKVFISQSMQHSTPEKVHYERNEIMKILRDLYPTTEFILIDQYDIEDPEEWKNKDARALRWARLARSIEMMGDANLIVFVDEAISGLLAPGCLAELTVAEKYQQEYQGQYEIVKYSELLKEHTTRNMNLQFLDNIMNCVHYDIAKYQNYFSELINIVKKYLHIDLDDFYVNDTETEWYVEYSSTQSPHWYACAELSKNVLVDSPDYDNGEFFTFVFETGTEADGESSITIKSYNNGETEGLKVVDYKIHENYKYNEIIKALKEACE